MSATVNKNMSISEVVMKWPETVGTFMEAGLHCFGCAAARFETIEQGAVAHGIDPDKLIEELNEIIEEKKK
jgi:hybrid cluster-associated redox disulfide protein